jgi:putative membrane protein insertion efficiency factor
MSLPARILRALVRLYQAVTAARPSPCRYVPTCSTYALEALEGHGAARGTYLTGRRLLRCHPWGGHGYDPVPHPAQPRHAQPRNGAPTPDRVA